MTWTLKANQEALLSLSLHSHIKLPDTSSKSGSWGPSAFLIQTVNISSSRIWGQRWNFSKTLNHLSCLLWRKKIYLFLRKKHKTQHLIIALSWHLIYFTTRSVFKNRKQIIMPERLWNLPIIPMCHHVASMEGPGGWGWGGVSRRKGGGQEVWRNDEEWQVARAQQFEITAWMNYLMYFLSWTKACKSWKGKQEHEFLRQEEKDHIHSKVAGLESKKNIFIKFFAYPSPL